MFQQCILVYCWLNASITQIFSSHKALQAIQPCLLMQANLTIVALAYRTLLPLASTRSFKLMVVVVVDATNTVANGNSIECPALLVLPCIKGFLSTGHPRRAFEKDKMNIH
ncbi:hypothetical protein V6Z12_A10G244800 [Gossypium hirsutum]